MATTKTTTTTITAAAAATDLYQKISSSFENLINRSITILMIFVRSLLNEYSELSTTRTLIREEIAVVFVNSITTITIKVYSKEITKKMSIKTVMTMIMTMTMKKNIIIVMPLWK